MSRQAAPGAAARRRPSLGFNLVSWDASPDPWFHALERIEALGVRRVTIVCYRFVDPGSGAITRDSVHGLAAGPSASLVAAVAERARSRELDIGISPFVEVDNPRGIGRVWRGSVAFREDRLDAFFSAYENYLGELAVIARRCGASRFYIGSELSGLTGDRKAAPYWDALIASIRDRAGPRESCRLGYAANHDEFERVPFWDQLDDVGVDAYFPLASAREAKGRSRPQHDVLMRGFDRSLRRLRNFSDRQQKPVTISEWGTVPFDLTTARPWDWQPSLTPDPDEQARAYQALLQSIGGAADWLAACDLWHWRMPGNEGSAYGIDQTCEAAGYIGRYATAGD